MKEFLGPYLLGTYESELHPWIERTIDSGFKTFVDIGAKFGYYSVGIAKRCPETQSIAFDTDSWARKAIRETANVNKVRNVEIRGFCDKSWLANSLPRNSFVLSDCEGYESVLFNGVTDSLRTSTILIETHDHEVANTSVAIRKTFCDSHRIEEVVSGTPRVSPVDLSFLEEKDQARVVDEARLSQSWLLLTPQR